MARLEQLISVMVGDKGKQGEKRKLVVEIEGGSDLFLLSDLLVQEGVLRDLPSFVKAANRKAVGEYISSGRELVKGVGNKGIKKEVISKKKVGQDKRIGSQFG